MMDALTYLRELPTDTLGITEGLGVVILSMDNLSAGSYSVLSSAMASGNPRLYFDENEDGTDDVLYARQFFVEFIADLDPLQLDLITAAYTNGPDLLAEYEEDDELEHARDIAQADHSIT
jgi:hypothetical protein